jgi:phosphatidylglycerol:prolipoprotein diacylglycerol transferase
VYPVLLQIGPFTIYSLGVLWALAAVCAGYVIRLELKRYSLDPELASSMVFAAAIGGLVGARLLFIFEEWGDFLRSPWEVVFSGAGFSWYGGLIGGIIAVTWWVRRHRIGWLKGADIAAPALASIRLWCRTHWLLSCGGCNLGKGYRRAVGNGVSQCGRGLG